ncbi:hypothetical protein ACQKKX_01175 [Neorhizobium sp. NPDC001467]|uniref:hypothetical protein n=1 Tax=Neorhizobium sp. NPDC001467 TaxID=3390595 RepID=UPI003D03D879
METFHNAPGPVQWTLADFLGTYRYWALFAAWLFVSVGAQGFGAVIPAISSMAGLSVASTSLYYSGTGVGWIGAAFIAFVVAGRSGRAALIVPLAVCAILLAAFAFLQPLSQTAPFLFLLGLSIGTVQALFPLATAVFLVGGRPGRIDFACAMALLSGAVLLSFLGPILVSLLYDDQGVTTVVAAVFICMVMAILAIAPAKRLAFEDVPRPRHHPLSPRQRSPMLLACVLLSAPVLWMVAAIGTDFFRAHIFADGPSPVVLFLSLALVIITFGALIYLLYWVYRIHGELAGAQASQRLVSPLAALLVALFVPLGLPVLLMTLGELLNDRAREKGRPRLLSIGWLATWCLLLPPVAMALIQHAVNRDYGSDGPQAEPAIPLRSTVSDTP